MAASPMHTEHGDLQSHDKWVNSGDHSGEPMGPAGDGAAPNNGPAGDDRAATDTAHPEYARSNGGGDAGSNQSGTVVYREKQVKPNKVYIGGLPEHTRQEDLQSCFGKIGTITNIELKVGYGFVEFESREAAEESVAKYHEGFFMGNKIRVELSRGGGRYAKYSADPGACFKCGLMGHWARECPNHVINGRRSAPGESPLIDRIRPAGDYPPPPPSRDYPSYREEHAPGRYPPARDSRYAYEYPPPRRPVSPPRDHRDYFPPPPRRADVDDYRMRGPPPSRYESRAGYYPPEEGAGYPRGYPPPPPRDYDRYDRRPPPPGDRFAPYPPPPSFRPRTPPGPPRGRDEFDRPPARDYPPPPEYRGRPLTPPPSRYADYPPRPTATEGRYRRRSQSPHPRTSATGYDSYNAGSSGYAAAPAGPSKASRDYPPRGGRDAVESNGSYRRP
ncbi:hypothetical protein HETIRDRAFT_431924 [Heterobasidion irregulare TC 32-1]|uniref:RNA-binding domain-containing protein n=1 Tax=Heterobasidion irregulare (strain TC 32-1) TaxID=747525 RepID=W4KP98_HETIT|nr:uncharacterized protein HETIRDRAFT_431924 [Heterobasidion irregulare TC 32-1]ETW87637.1 hypothetical protein HETIRDRAFT_431924 [Heterobasidion irregulare TC 32-1]